MENEGNYISPHKQDPRSVFLCCLRFWNYRPRRNLPLGVTSSCLYMQIIIKSCRFLPRKTSWMHPTLSAWTLASLIPLALNYFQCFSVPTNSISCRQLASYLTHLGMTTHPLQLQSRQPPIAKERCSFALLPPSLLWLVFEYWSSMGFRSQHECRVQFAPHSAPAPCPLWCPCPQDWTDLYRWHHSGSLAVAPPCLHLKQGQSGPPCLWS